jgi:hypothetical protein
MKLFLMLFGFVCLNLGIILALHFDFTIGLLVSAYGVCTFWLMLPSNRGQNDL